jgi:hypothetical protein
MKRSMIAATTVAAALAFTTTADAKLTWGGIRAWVKKSIADVVGQIKDPKVKEVVDGLRKSVNELKGNLKGLYPQYRALVGYLSVAAAKSAEGKVKPEDIQALADKVKESATKIGKGGLKMVRDWLKANDAKFKEAGKVFKVAFKKIANEFKNKVHGWWKKMAKKMKKAIEKAGAGSPAEPKAADAK